MGKLKLLAVVVATIAFLLSLWAVPAVMVIVAAVAVKTLWIRVALCVIAALWLLMLRPWTMFSDSNFGRFVSDMRRAFNALIS
ncbi:hypothetical protein [uncultured Duncaniella sp.]|uniref:hypothetical protein n=1 Tax=uncultured Duncaniella sp. TaxID=2768039 RepID=UPI00272A25BE|nr:hypothetical protein [uncultured Duncaniella sp.]